jgi:hypothetical protein
MDETRAVPLGGAGNNVQGRGLLALVNGELNPPDNIIMTVEAARTYHRNFRQAHVKRIMLMAAIEGLIAGNPPYDPAVLKAAGLSHIANVNTLDAKAMYERVALTFWNLVNQTENYVVFEIHKMNDLGMDHDYSGWAQVLAKNWTRAVKRKWKGFIKQMNIMTGQLVKFGVSPVVWSDERDCRWKSVNLNKFYTADRACVDSGEWDCMCFESVFTVQRLYAIYLETKNKQDSPWNREELENFLLKKANLSSKGRDNNTFTDMLDLQKAIQNQSYNFAQTFSDSVSLVSLLYREFSGKISHFIFEPFGDTRDFLCKIDEQYENFEEALVVFTYSPGEEEIHGNRGVGHKIYPICQGVMQLDCHMLDGAKMAATQIISTNATTGRNMDPIQVISGVITDIGQAELKPNTLGSNLPGLIEVAQYFESKVNRNSIIGGDDPGVPDGDRGSKSAPEIQMQSIKEFGVGKQSVAHFYETFDVVLEQMTIKMIHAKKGYPCYDIVKEWKRLCEKDGVPTEVFDIPVDTANNELPDHLSVRAARVAGDGSNLGLIMGLNGVAGIAGGFRQKGQYNYRKDVITSRLGADYVDRYLSDSAEPDESGSGASVAHLENLVMRMGEMPQATQDNNHKVHIGSHMAFINQLIQQIQAQKIDPIEADKQLSVAMPHTGEHIDFLTKDILNKSFIEKITPAWRQITKFAQLNRVKAQKMMQAEVRRRADAQQQADAATIDQQRKDQVAQKEQQRKDFESQAKQDRAKEQSQTKADIMKQSVETKAANERLAVELKAHTQQLDVIKKPQDILANQSTENLQTSLQDQVGTTPNPADFK